MCENSFGESVVIPSFQAFITGGLAGLSSGAAAAALECPFPFELGLWVGSTAAFIAWLDYRHSWRVFLERLSGIDLNGDGVIGEEPTGKREPVRVEVISNEGRQGDYIDLPARENQLRQLADGLISGKQFSQSVWTGNGAPFSRSEFEALRSEFIRRKLARWRKEGAPGQGIELTPPGWAVIRHFATNTLRSPTLLPDDGREL